MTSQPETAILPPLQTLRILFAHAAYGLKSVFDEFGDGVASSTAVTTRDALIAALPETDVLVISNMWTNDLFDHAPQLKFVQSISAGTNQYDFDAFRQAGVPLASAAGNNLNAVSEHALALLLALTRQIPQAVAHQKQHQWRPMIADLAQREQELPGKTALIIGTGLIGNRIARLLKALDMQVIGVRRDPTRGAGAADEIHGFRDLQTLLPRADVVILSCPLTDETHHIIDAAAFAQMKPTAFLINVARGACVDETALIAACETGQIAGAGIDVTEIEPLPPTSALWDLPNVLITPHSAGETQRCEANVVAILRENLARLGAGNTDLLNRVV